MNAWQTVVYVALIAVCLATISGVAILAVTGVLNVIRSARESARRRQLPRRASYISCAHGRVW